MRISSPDLSLDHRQSSVKFVISRVWIYFAPSPIARPLYLHFTGDWNEDQVLLGYYWATDCENECRKLAIIIQMPSTEAMEG